jgi:hypothetical protein
VQALEYVNAGTVTFFGGFSGSNMGLFLTTEY